MDNTQAENFVATVLPAVDAHSPHCKQHKDLPGQAVCPVCEGLFCLGCMCWDGETLTASCVNCAAQQHLRRRLRSSVIWLLHPLFYVILLATAGALIYIANLRGNSPVALAARDSGKPWFNRHTGRLHLRQALRARTRAEALQTAGAVAEARQWFGLAATAFTQAVAIFNDADCRLDLEIAAFAALGNAGRQAEAMQAAMNIGANLKQGDTRRLPYLFNRGSLHWQAGNRQAAIADWRTVVRETAPRETDIIAAFGTSPLDDAIGGVGDGGLFEIAMLTLVRQAADTNPKGEIWRARTLDKASSLGVDMRELLGAAGGNNAPAAQNRPPDITIERF